MALYAWSPINAGEKSAKYGDEVSESKLGISKEDLQALAESGAVREKKPPKLPEDWQGSVVEFLRSEAAAAETAAGGTVDEANLAAASVVGEVG